MTINTVYKSAILGKMALTAVEIALSFASCDFPIAVHNFSQIDSHPCDYLYKY